MGYSLFRVRSHPIAQTTAGLLTAVLALPFPVLAQVADAPEVQPADPAPVVETTPEPPAPTLDTTIPGSSPEAPVVDTPSPTVPPADAPPADASAPTTDQSASPDAAATDQADVSQAALAAAGVANPPTPSISAPNVFSAQTTQPKVDGNTGALTFRIPLDIPPGRNGVQPDLALSYNSQNTQDGVVGYGWEISIPYITRLNKTGSNNLYSAGYFTSSLDGELATTSTSTPNLYRGRVDESRRTYSFSSNTWTVYDKSGTRYTFGSAAQSQLAATTSPSNVYRWYLDEIRDTNNNYVRFVYARDANQLYPLQIYYTGNGVADGIFRVDFATSTRPDPVTDYRAGFKVITNHRISQISAYVNGSLARQYALGYASGNNGKRSLLSTIQQSGNGDAGNTTLPSLSFSYVSTTTQFVSPSPTSPIRGPAWIPADVDGDGNNDVSVLWRDDNGASTATINNVTTPAIEYWAGNNPVTPDHHPAWERGVRFLDINADGKADIVQHAYDYTLATSTNKEILLSRYDYGSAWSNGYGADWSAWVATTTGVNTLPVISYDGSGSLHGMSTGVFADVNADGLPDFVQRVDGFYSSTTYLGNGSGWVSTTTIFGSPGSFPVPTTPTGQSLQFIDINGDTLPDAVATGGSNILVTLNNGRGWDAAADPQWTFATSTTVGFSGSYYDRGFRFLDINGDGLPDLIHSYGGVAPAPEVANYSQVFINTGSGWATSSAYTLPAQIVTANSADQQMWTFNEYANFIGNGQMPQDVLSTITYPKGGTADIAYQPSTQSSLNTKLPYEILTVTSITNHDGRGSSEQTTYTYRNGKQYYPSFLPDRKFAGFGSTTETRADRITTTFFSQGDATSTSAGEQSDGYPQMNHPFRVDVTSPAGTLMQQTFNRWDAILHGNVWFLGLGRQVVQSYAADGTHRDRATDYSYLSAIDDLATTTDYGEVTGNSDGTFTDNVSDGRVTTYAYAASSTANLSVLTEKQTQSVATLSGPAGSTQVSVLAVGGGGAGGTAYSNGFGAGGGGGGGVVYDAAHTVSVNTYSITVGAGGVDNGTGAPTSGATSTFDTINAVGGGAGQDNNTPSVGKSGGSGGGGGSINIAGMPTGGAGTAGQGNAGGDGNTASGGAGGGGGAGAAGTSGTSVGGAGGIGIANSISGTSTYYGGGGGGGALSGGNGGAGGLGGGGAATSASGPGVAGTNGLGGGGGAGWGSAKYGGNGGSGVVIISYPTGSLTATGGATSTAAGKTIHTFTSSGTFTVSAINGTSTSSNWTTVADTKYYYDNLAFGSVTKGNSTRQDNWKSGASFASSTATYNSYGLVTQSTDRRGATTTYAYDANNLYPATVTNALGRATQYTYNYANGQVIQTTDPNGRLTKNLYDGLGRVIEKQQSDLSTPASLVTATTFTYTDNSTPPSIVKQTDYLTAATTTDAYTFTDGLGREIQKRVKNNAGTYTTTDKAYNSVGMLYSSTLPYFSSGTSLTSPTATTTLYTTFVYDALGRTTTVSDALGSTNTVFAKWTSTVTDKNGHIKDYTKDAFGNLVQVIEHANAGNYTTTYGYDALDNLASTTDALGNVRAFTYDGLSRRLTATDLHAPADGTFGTYTYTYDDGSNLTSQLDPKGQTINRTYDALGRLTTEDYTAASGTEVTLTYDTCTYGIGALCVASTSAAKITNVYDILGRISAATTTISGFSYPASQTYDRQGNITSITYPTRSRIDYSFGAGGLINSVLRTASNGATTSIASFIDYAPIGKPSSIVFPSGITTSFTYDFNKLYRLTRILTATSTQVQIFVPVPKSVSALVVGGGGGGGQGWTGGSVTAGGGGAGGYISTSSKFVIPQAYTITIGAGGAGGNSPFGANGNNGGDTIFDTITALGGGAGGYAGNGFNGGAGGGAGGQAGTMFGGTGSQGGNGGNATGLGAGTAAAGGGGAGGNGNPNSGSTQGLGGSGLSNSISGATITYAVGGDGSPPSNITVKSGAANSGTGGDGGYSNAGGSGGSGIVIIRYPTGTLVASGGTISTTSTDTIHKFTASSTFSVLQTATTTATTTIVYPLLDLNYTYDPVGNITAITDNGSTSPSRSVAYTYDNLDRLLTASTTASSSVPYSLTYAYDALGNITSSVGTTTTNYSYAQTGYANPDAPTTVGGLSLAYDNNGNVTSHGTKAFSYDYLNRLTQAVIGAATSTYGYDYSGARVLQAIGFATTSYVGRFFSIASTTSTTTPATQSEYIFLGDTLLAQADVPAFTAISTSTPSLVATTTNYTTTTLGTTTRQWALATSTAANRFLALFADIKQATVGIGSISAAYLITPTGTTSLTLATTSRTQNARSEIWYLVNPPAASSTVTVTVVGTTSEIKLGTALFSGISQSMPIDVIATSAGLSGNPSITVSTTTPNEVFAATIERTSATSATSTRTSLYRYLTAGNLAAASYTISTTSGSLTDTYVGSFAANWSMAALLLRPATTTNGTVISYIHTDHLGSTALVTNTSGTPVQTLDYYPYGGTRVSSGSQLEARQYIGQFSDTSGLSYLNARYYDGQRGQFTSQDPVFWEVGQTKDGINALQNPQSLNSYGYANDNPIVNKDPNGRYIESGFDIAMLALSVNAFRQDPSWSNAAGVVLDAGSLALPGVPAVGGIALRAGKAADAAYTVYQGVDAAGTVRYVGITGREATERFLEHGNAVGTGKDLLKYGAVDGTGNLTKTKARIWEQSLINQYGLQKNGGQLLNKINSISQKSPLYNSVQNFSGGGGSGSSGAVIGLYQAVVAKLSAIVSILSGKK